MLSGTKDIGDEYVRWCLELVTEEPERLEGNNLRLELYTAFHQCWNVVSKVTTPSAEALDEQERLEEGLASLAPLERRVLLLSVVEDFTPAEVGRILAMDEKTVRQQLRDAHHHLKQQVMVPVLIIEDEPMIAKEVKEIVESMVM
jgi:RNA polymerase sigma factor (sigma-70 family)